METIELYIVRNKEGKYLRSKGYSGYGNSWVENLKNAKVYTKKGIACSQITYWANNFPEYGVPDLIPLNATLGEPIDQTDRVNKSIKNKMLNKAKEELKRVEDEYNKAVSNFENAKTNLLLKKVEKLNELNNLKKLS